MAEFKPSEVAKMTNTTQQNIYKKLDFLMEHNLAHKNEKGKFVITTAGVNYIKDKQEKIQQLREAKMLKQENLTAKRSIENSMLNSTYIDQVEQLKKEVEEWKVRYDNKDNAFQEFVAKNQCLLNSSKEENSQLENRTSQLIKEGVVKDEQICNLEKELKELKTRGFFARLFNK